MARKAFKPIKVFVSFSHRDEELRANLEHHSSFLERDKMVEPWHDGKISPGTEWKEEIFKNLDEAELILLLVSSDFIHSQFCYDVEMKRAIERHDEGKACVIPVILRPCVWKKTPFSKLQALPEGGKPVTKWRLRDDALANAAIGIEKAVEKLIKKRSAAPIPKPRRKVPAKLEERLKIRLITEPEMTEEEREILRKDSEILANKFVKDRQLQRDIRQAALKVLEQNRGWSLTKKQLEELDERFLRKREKRKYPDPKKIRWVLRAALLHPQGRKKTHMTVSNK